MKDTTNILFHLKNNFFVAADTRTSYITKSGACFIAGETARKISIFGTYAFSTFCGDFELGDSILRHLEEKFSMNTDVPVFSTLGKY
ncbi:hypothetical protein OROGR_000032 [Orobanche gracilis]